MKLHHINLVGILVLSAICVGQWRRNRGLNLEVNRLEQTGHEQSSKIAEQEKALRGVNLDLSQFKDQFTQSETELKDARQKLRTSEHDLLQLASERAQLKTSVTNWAAAVSLRDERLGEAAGQLHRLAEDLNASVRKFNELASNHNAVVKDLNDLRRRLTSREPAQPPPAP